MKLGYVVSILIAIVTTTYYVSQLYADSTSPVPLYLAMIHDRSICTVNQMIDAVTGSSVMKKPRASRKWSAEEDALLRQAVATVGESNWVAVSKRRRGKKS